MTTASDNAPRFSNPPTLAKPPGYSYVVETTGPGRTIYIAGQLGLDMDNNIVTGGFEAQAMKAFENMRLALEAAGATFADVVKILNYFTNIEQDIKAYHVIRDRFVNTKAPPASTAIGVAGLARPGAVFEIDAIAVLPPK